MTAAALTLGPATLYLLLGHWAFRAAVRRSERGRCKIWWEARGR